MNVIHSQLVAARASLFRIEETVWRRNPYDALLEGREALLPYLMTVEERSLWLATRFAVAEMLRRA